MKIFITLLLVIVLSSSANAQIDILGKIEDKVEQKIDQKTDEAIDKALEDPKEKEEEKKKEKDEEKSSNANTTSAAKEDFKSYTKFDFVPGEKITFFDDFSSGAIGDFPVNWNTSGSGEMVTVGNLPGRWLKWSAGVSYAPQLKDAFPENFTLEFDILMKKNEDKGDPYFGITIYSSPKDEMENPDGIGAAGTYLQTQSTWDVTNWNGAEVQRVGTSAEVPMSSLFDHSAHISVWGQKQRFRVYVNEKKVLDLPQGLPQGAKLNRIKFTNNPGLNLSNDEAGPIFLTNVRIAVGAPDMRSKLMTEGKLVTHGILFDVGSDKIKPESYGTLKEIASVLKENAAVRVKIIGHTDSDGDDNKNLELSKKRSASVKASLAKDFEIDASRMETDGKGESQPASPNTNPEGKANNRRVEFVKQ